MKNFIKAHPWLSCAGLALANNAAFGLTCEAKSIIEGESISAFVGLVLGTILTTLPAIGITTFDRYIHQNITENAPIQYGLTTVESLLSYPSIFSICGYDDDNKHLFTLDLSNNNSILSKLVVLGTLIQSLGFKYIFDLAAEKDIPDYDQQIENDQSLFVEENLQGGFEAEIII